MIALRAAAAEDLDQIVAVHIAAFPTFFLTALGAPFLRAYYRTVREYPGGILLLAVEGAEDRSAQLAAAGEGRPDATPGPGGAEIAEPDPPAQVATSVAGFVAGFLDPPAFYGWLRRRWVRFAWPVVVGVLRRPVLLRRAIFNVRRTGRDAARQEQAPGGRDCELSSLAVGPSESGKGMGRTLVLGFLAESSRRGARQVTLTTDAAENERVNLFYRQLGFEQAGQVPGARRRVLNLYRHDLTDVG